jgi:ribosomal protein L14E/L6E/L27E
MKEIIIVETQNGEKVKNYLEKEHENYKVYYENEEDYWRQAVRAASQDEQRNKEITAWDKISSKIKDK